MTILLFTSDLGVLYISNLWVLILEVKIQTSSTPFPEDPTAGSAAQDVPPDTSLLQGTSIFPNQIRTTLIKGKQEAKVR